jgi:hypothetical protein
VGGNVGSIDVRNAVIISDNGESGNLIATFVNNDAKSHRVLVQHGTTKKTDQYVTVEPGQVKTIGSDDGKQIQFTDMNVQAGAMLPVYFQYGDKTGVQELHAHAEAGCAAHHADPDADACLERLAAQVHAGSPSKR